MEELFYRSKRREQKTLFQLSGPPKLRFSTIPYQAASAMRFDRLVRKGSIAIVLLFTACATSSLSQFDGTEPFQLEEYFKGTTLGHGQIYRFGKTLSRRFTVTIDGYWEGEEFILDEHFKFADGKEVKRVWRIHRADGDSYKAFANDVEGAANGEAVGKAIRWNYRLNLRKFGSGSYTVSVDDWMFRHSDRVVFNRATMTKLGVTVGEMVVVFEKVD